jgi:putative ABC transport system ATP-binding protein
VTWRGQAAETTQPAAGAEHHPAAGAQTAPGGVTVVLDDVVKSYGRVKALRGVSFDVASGEFVVVAGPSGSGKSTLLNLIGTLDQPDSGTIAVGGRPVPAPREAVEFRRRLVGFVFQDNLLLPYLSAQSNVETALLATGVGRDQRHGRSQQLLDEVGLADRLKHLPSELSAGERQRVAIARALANEPQLLLADEPTGALDSDSSERVLGLLSALRARRGMTVVMTSHDETVARRADRVLRLVDGQILTPKSAL